MPKTSSSKLSTGQEKNAREKFSRGSLKKIHDFTMEKRDWQKITVIPAASARYKFPKTPTQAPSSKKARNNPLPE